MDVDCTDFSIAVIERKTSQSVKTKDVRHKVGGFTDSHTVSYKFEWNQEASQERFFGVEADG